MRSWRGWPSWVDSPAHRMAQDVRLGVSRLPDRDDGRRDQGFSSYSMTRRIPRADMGKLDMQSRKFGLALASIVMAVASFAASAQSFTNASTITINDAVAATPYPSSIAVSGVTSTSNKVTVTLNGFSHTWSGDLNIVVVAPNGQKVALANRVGGSNNYTGGTYTFVDTAASIVTGDGSGNIPAGSYRASGGANNLTAPGPTGPYGSVMDAMGTGVNGNWSLYIADQAGADVGQVSGGWTVSFTANVTCASEGYTYTKLSWCQNICEKGYEGATLDMWIHRWTERYRRLPYCAVAPTES